MFFVSYAIIGHLLLRLAFAELPPELLSPVSSVCCAHSDSIIWDVRSSTEIFTAHVDAVIVNETMVTVLKSWRGNQPKHYQIDNRAWGPYRFQPGQDYLIYSYRGEVSECGSTKPLSEAQADIRFLQKYSVILTEQGAEDLEFAVDEEVRMQQSAKCLRASDPDKCYDSALYCEKIIDQQKRGWCFRNGISRIWKRFGADQAQKLCEDLPSFYDRKESLLFLAKALAVSDPARGIKVCEAIGGAPYTDLTGAIRFRPGKVDKEGCLDILNDIARHRFRSTWVW